MLNRKFEKVNTLEQKFSKIYLENLIYLPENKSNLALKKILEKSRISHCKNFNKQISTPVLSENLFETDSKFFCYSIIKNKRRITENVLFPFASYCDFDIYENTEETIKKVLSKLKEKCLPIPSIIKKSGRGFWIEYIHEFKNIAKNENEILTYFENLKTAAKTINKSLISLFNSLGADKACSDLTRLSRIPGSTNEKNNNEVEIFTSNKKYDLLKLQEKFCLSCMTLPEEKKEPATIKEKPLSSSVIFQSIKTPENEVFHGKYFLALIEEHLKNNTIKNGTRENTCFAVANCFSVMGRSLSSAYRYIENKILNKMDSYTKQEWAKWKQEILSAFRLRNRKDGSIERGYNLSIKKLSELLSLEHHYILALKDRLSPLKRLNLKRKTASRPNPSQKIRRGSSWASLVSNELFQKTVYLLLKKGKTQSEIAFITNTSEATISRTKSKIESENMSFNLKQCFVAFRSLVSILLKVDFQSETVIDFAKSLFDGVDGLLMPKYLVRIFRENTQNSKKLLTRVLHSAIPDCAVSATTI